VYFLFYLFACCFSIYYHVYGKIKLCILLEFRLGHLIGNAKGKTISSKYNNGHRQQDKKVKTRWTARLTGALTAAVQDYANSI